jgi:hypothetical protein
MEQVALFCDAIPNTRAPAKHIAFAITHGFAFVPSTPAMWLNEHHCDPNVNHSYADVDYRNRDEHHRHGDLDYRNGDQHLADKHHGDANIDHCHSNVADWVASFVSQAHSHI